MQSSPASLDTWLAGTEPLLECTGDPKSKNKDGDNVDKVSSHSIYCYEPYPLELLQKYSHLIHADASDEANGSIFVTKDLCAEILRDETNFTELTRHMKENF
jgi:hypothetical protein